MFRMEAEEVYKGLTADVVVVVEEEEEEEGEEGEEE